VAEFHDLDLPTFFRAEDVEAGLYPWERPGPQTTLYNELETMKDLIFTDGSVTSYSNQDAYIENAGK
jgi:hypothetical protein